MIPAKVNARAEHWRGVNVKRAYTKFIAAVLLFGTNGIVASHITLSSYETILIRSLIATLFLAVIFLFGRDKPEGEVNKRHLGYLGISGAAMGFSWILIFEAYSQIGVSLTALLYYCGPVIVMIFAPLIFSERINRAKIAGFAIVLIGMLCVNSVSILRKELSWGLLCAILSAFMYAVMVIFNKLAKSITGLKNAVYQLAASFIAVAVYTALCQDIAVSAIAQNILPLLILGVVNTGIGCYLYFSSAQVLPAGSVAICGYLELLSALVLSAVILNERLMPLQIAGAVLILGGTFIGEGVNFKAKAAIDHYKEGMR